MESSLGNASGSWRTINPAQIGATTAAFTSNNQSSTSHPSTLRRKEARLFHAHTEQTMLGAQLGCSYQAAASPGPGISDRSSMAGKLKCQFSDSNIKRNHWAYDVYVKCMYKILIYTQNINSWDLYSETLMFLIKFWSFSNIGEAIVIILSIKLFVC